MEVSVRHVTYPFADRSDVFLGYGAVSSWNGPAEIIPLLNQPMKAQFAALAGPTADTAYILLIKHASNARQVDAANANFVNRVVVYGPTGNFVGGLYDDVNFADKDLLIGLGNRPMDNVRRNLAYIGGVGNDMFGVTEAIQGAHESADRLFRRNYLPQNQGPNTTPLQRAVKVTGQVSDLTGNLSGTKSNLETLVPKQVQPAGQ